MDLLNKLDDQLFKFIESYKNRYIPKNRCYITNVPEDNLDKIVLYKDDTDETPLVYITTLEKLFPGFKIYDPIKYSDCKDFPLPSSGFRQVMIMVSDPGSSYTIPMDVTDDVIVKSYLWWRGLKSKIYPISDNYVTFEKPDIKVDSNRVYMREGKCTVAPKILKF